ncbi:MAG: aminotransferase class IV [Bacteroidota bacterium]
MYTYCYFNGNIIPFKEAAIAINDLGMLRGYGVFDYMRTYNGKPFLLDEYLQRFYNSAKYMRLDIQESEEKIKEIITKLLKVNTIKNDVGIRFVLTGGATADNFSLRSTSTFFILIEKFDQPAISIYEKGVKLISYDYLRLFPEIKTTNYIMAINLQPIIKQESAVDVLYKNKGLMLETARSNFFIFKGNTLITAKNNVLIGRTRNFVLKLVNKKFKIEERDILETEINSATEAFITSTTKNIVPVVKIDNSIIGDGNIGRNTHILMQLFEKQVRAIL